MKGHYKLQELIETYRLDQGFVTQCLRCHWVTPLSEKELEFDEEDLARIRLILELKRDFEVNDEAIPIILHLLDQLHHFRSQMKKMAG
jgi:chaperone modulatory protein CbpM